MLFVYVRIYTFIIRVNSNSVTVNGEPFLDKPRQRLSPVIGNLSQQKLRAGNFPCFQGAGADVNAFRFAVYENAHFLHVDTPGALGFIGRMGNVVARFRGLAGNAAFAGHALHLLFGRSKNPYYLLKTYSNILSTFYV